MPFVNRFSGYGIKCAFIMDDQQVHENLDITVEMHKP